MCRSSGLVNYYAKKGENKSENVTVSKVKFFRMGKTKGCSIFSSSIYGVYLGKLGRAETNPESLYYDKPLILLVVSEKVTYGGLTDAHHCFD